jgi:hypothetical protein
MLHSMKKSRYQQSGHGYCAFVNRATKPVLCFFCTVGESLTGNGR